MTNELIPTERVGIIVYQLCLGKRLHIADVQTLTGLSRRGAYDIMYRLSRVLPLYCDDGEWLLNQWEEQPRICPLRGRRNREAEEP